MKTRNITIVDFVEVGKNLPDGYFSELLEYLNNSDVSFGNNDDTLIRSDNFVTMMEEVVEGMEDNLSNRDIHKVNLVIDFLKKNDDCMVALGS